MRKAREIWRDIPECEGCKVSSIGRIKNNKGKIVKGGRWRDLYWRVTLFRKEYLVHRLVAKAFLGLIPKGCLVHHKDEDSFNNLVGNLEFMTLGDHNSYHKRRLTKEEVLDIRTSKLNTYELGEKYNMVNQSIGAIKRKRVYKYI